MATFEEMSTTLPRHVAELHDLSDVTQIITLKIRGTPKLSALELEELAHLGMKAINEPNIQRVREAYHDARAHLVPLGGDSGWRVLVRMNTAENVWAAVADGVTEQLACLRAIHRTK